MLKIDRRLCVGLIMVGAMSHYSAAELQKHKEVEYVAKTLMKKHFVQKNGTPKQRLNRDYGAILELKERWGYHAEISNKAWMRAADKFPETNAITVNHLVLALLRKEEDTKKHYKFNQKKLDKFASVGIDGHLFSSSKVATQLLKCLDEEIATFNYNQSKVV